MCIYIYSGPVHPWFLLCYTVRVAALWLGKQILELFKDWKSVIFGVWAAPGAPEILAKGGGATFLKGLQGPRGHPDPQNDRFPILNLFNGLLLCYAVRGTNTWGRRGAGRRR